MTAKKAMLDAMLAIGSAHAGQRLTHDELLERLKDDAFRARFNGPIPEVVMFPNEDAARTARTLEAALSKPTKPAQRSRSKVCACGHPKTDHYRSKWDCAACSCDDFRSEEVTP